MARIKKDFESKYIGIGELLEKNQDKSEITLTFKEIEKKVGKLPSSAKKFYTWWANNRTPKAPCRHSRVWLSKGYLVKSVNLKKGEVYFIKARKKKKVLPRAEAILKAAKKLMEEGKKSFSRKEISITIARLFPKMNFKIQSIDSAIQAMKEGSKSSHLVAKEWRNTLKHIKRGFFTLTKLGETAKKNKIEPVKKMKDEDVIKENLEKEFNTKFLKKDLKVNKNLTIPVDWLSENNKMAVKIFELRTRRKKTNYNPYSKVLEKISLFEKANIKKPLIIFKKTILRLKDREKLIKELKDTFKGMNIYLYEKKSYFKTGNLIKL
jgi:hypothetical protein